MFCLENLPSLPFWDDETLHNKNVSIRKKSTKAMKELMGWEKLGDKTLLIMFYHRENILHMEILDPKFPTPKTPNDWKVEELKLTLDNSNPLTKLTLLVS